MNSYYFSVLNVKLHTAVRLFTIWFASGVSGPVPFVTDLTSPLFLQTNHLVPKVFVKNELTACVLTIPSDLHCMHRMLMKNSQVLCELLYSHATNDCK